MSAKDHSLRRPKDAMQPLGSSDSPNEAFFKG
jgi:hypothetical protein